MISERGLDMQENTSRVHIISPPEDHNNRIAIDAVFVH